jgi:hypothetical protein
LSSWLKTTPAWQNSWIKCVVDSKSMSWKDQNIKQRRAFFSE